MKLYQAISDYFKEDELKSICSDLGIEFEDLHAEGKTGKARELVASVVRLGKENALIEILKESRPDAKIDWEHISFPPKPLRDRFSHTNIRVILTVAGLVGSLAVISIMMFCVVAWILLVHQGNWAIGKPVDEELFGIAIAEFTVGADQNRSEQGREMSQLLYQQLDDLLRQQSGLTGQVVLTKVGVVRNVEEAKEAAEKVNADLVLWGWIPEFTEEAIVPNFTALNEDLLESNSPFLQSVSLMINSPETNLRLQVSKRTLTVSRLIIGYIYLKDAPASDYSKALEVFDNGIWELEQELESINTLLENPDNLEQRLALESSQQVVMESLAAFYTAKGIAHAALSEPEQAISSYSKALQFDETYPRVYLAFGSYYYNERQFEDAKFMFEKAKLLEPNNPAAYYGLGLTTYYLGAYEASVVYYNKAIELAGDSGEPLLVYLGLGFAYERLGRLAEAQQAFDMVLGSSTASDEIRDAAKEAILELSSSTLTPTIPPPGAPIATTTLLPTATPVPGTGGDFTPLETPTPMQSPPPIFLPAATITLLPTATSPGGSGNSTPLPTQTMPLTQLPTIFIVPCRTPTLTNTATIVHPD